MSDLLERLRGYRPQNEWGDGVEHTICNEAADEIERLRLALTDVTNPLGNLKRYAEERGTTLNGSAYSIANNLSFVQRIAKEALEGSPAFSPPPLSSPSVKGGE